MAVAQPAFIPFYLRLNAYEVIGINFVEPFWGVLGQRKPNLFSTSLFFL
jgi:hypothetical protein